MPIEATTQENSTAGVVPAAPWRLKALSVLPGYRLAVTFLDGTCGIVDLSRVRPEPSQGVFAELADPRLFEQARIQLGAVTWPNGADLDPLWMYERIAEAEDKMWYVPLEPCARHRANIPAGFSGRLKWGWQSSNHVDA